MTYHLYHPISSPTIDAIEIDRTLTLIGVYDDEDEVVIDTRGRRIDGL